MGVGKKADTDSRNESFGFDDYSWLRQSSSPVYSRSERNLGRPWQLCRRQRACLDTFQGRDVETMTKKRGENDNTHDRYNVHRRGFHFEGALKNLLRHRPTKRGLLGEQ